MAAPVKTKLLVPYSGSGLTGGVVHGGETANIPEDVAVQLAAVNKATILGNLTPRGTAYQTAYNNYIASGVAPVY